MLSFFVGLLTWLLVFPFGAASTTSERQTLVLEPEYSVAQPVEGHRGSEQEPAPEPEPNPEQRTLYEANTTVLESREHIPMLCLGGMADSYPPQCGDVPVDGWDWDAVRREESANGTTWGSYYVRGTFQEGRFGLVKVGRFRNESSRDDYDFSPACDGPWLTPNPGKTSYEDFEAATSYSNKQRDVAAVWVSYLDEEDPPEERDEMLLNAAFTGRLEHHEAEIRERWGGPLCVVRYDIARRRLLRIQRQLHGTVADELGYQPLGSSVDEVGSTVELHVVLLTAELKAELKDRYGDLVEATGALQPVRRR